MGAVSFCAIGIDIGKKADPSAVCVAMAEERGLTRAGESVTHYVAPFLQRLPLETKYPQQVARFVEIITGAAQKCQWKCPPPEVFMDVTGVGEGPADLLEPELRKIGIRGLNRVRFTHGDRITAPPGRQISIGKSWMGSRLQILAESQRVHLPDIPEARALAEELLDFDIEVDEDGGEKLGAMRPGTHDDMVIALALATLKESHRGRARIAGV
ncbi:MAG: hypothetical protein A4E48_00441 [Methanosaeta sp. PtaU1.Bin060]|nr:MAG: hypothetical protein A4E48_00441 [Methanosaeta sp. PtaU1.Bin060]